MQSHFTNTGKEMLSSILNAFEIPLFTKHSESNNTARKRKYGELKAEDISQLLISHKKKVNVNMLQRLIDKEKYAYALIWIDEHPEKMRWQALEQDMLIRLIKSEITPEVTSLILKLIESRKFNLNFKSHEKTALSKAIEYKYSEIAVALINTGEIVITNTTILKNVILKGHDDIARALISKYGFSHFYSKANYWLDDIIDYYKIKFGYYKKISDGRTLQAQYTLTALEAFNKIRNGATILSIEELVYYFWFIKNSNKPSQNKFIISGLHWVSGLVSLSDTKVNVFINDSILKYFKKDDFIFLRKIFKGYQKNLYLPFENRQSDCESCNIFALNQIRRLEKIEDFLPPEYHNDIFEYLNKNTVKSEKFHSMNVHYSLIPLYLMKETQSRKLLTTIIPSRSAEEQTASVNNKGESASVACSSTFVKNKEGIVVNTKITKKFDSLKRITFDFINTKHSELLGRPIIDAVNEKTVSGFAKRVGL